MKILFPWSFNRLSASALLLIGGCAAAGPVDESGSRISVMFVEPEKFTDARCADLAPTSDGVLRELETSLVALACT